MTTILRPVWRQLLLALIVLFGAGAYFIATPLLEADYLFSVCDDYDPRYSREDCDALTP